MSSADRLVAAGWVLGPDGYWTRGGLRCATLEALEAEERGVVWDRASGGLRVRRKPGRRGEGRTVALRVWLTEGEMAEVRRRAEERGVGVAREVRERGVLPFQPKGG